jgi:hypothetical protein
MYNGIQDSATRRLTITLYLDVDKFCRELVIGNTQEIIVMWVGRDGTVFNRVSGAYSQQKAESLRTISQNMTL